jgi:hypothetical protein
MELTFKGELADFQQLFPGSAPADVFTPDILTRLDALKAQGEAILAKQEAAAALLTRLNDLTNTMAEAVDQVITKDQAEDDAFRAEIADLKQKLADGTLDEAALDSLLEGGAQTATTLEAIRDGLKAIGADPAAPVPEVVIPPVDPAPPVVEG